MVDQAKRNTLKNVAGIGVGTIAIAASPSALAQLSTNSNAASTMAVNDGLVDIEVTTRISSTTNDLEVVLTNTGEVPANITNMTPSAITTPRGLFDFNALFKEGDVKLAKGESVSVPMQHHPVVLDGSAIGKRTSELTASLRRNISIITDGDSLAAVTIKPLASFA